MNNFSSQATGQTSRRSIPPLCYRNQCDAKQNRDVLEGLILVPGHDCGRMNKECSHCGALKWKYEYNNVCCMSGKVKLPDYPEPPEAIKNLFLGNDERSSVFRKYVRQLNNALSMASVKIGNSQSNVDGFNPTVFLQVSFAR